MLCSVLEEHALPGRVTHALPERVTHALPGRGVRGLQPGHVCGVRGLHPGQQVIPNPGQQHAQQQTEVEGYFF